ncbi:hypothetical protein POVCU1_013800 [Plasmodium ovale curtisi]|uniref:Uncharacterized protein n=1 Tax=Plasmodium ovale curtisi TaxID=864141 RepID=A0A1A8W4B7_PLAOA|nr:hypothetical protein POVCU1_013800 [Plasmodium ovale curtisi]
MGDAQGRGETQNERGAIGKSQWADNSSNVNFNIKNSEKRKKYNRGKRDSAAAQQGRENWKAVLPQKDFVVRTVSDAIGESADQQDMFIYTDISPYTKVYICINPPTGVSLHFNTQTGMESSIFNGQNFEIVMMIQNGEREKGREIGVKKVPSLNINKLEVGWDGMANGKFVERTLNHVPIKVVLLRVRFNSFLSCSERGTLKHTPPKLAAVINDLECL